MQIFPASNKKKLKKLLILTQRCQKGSFKIIFNKLLRFENGVSESSKDIVSESPQQELILHIFYNFPQLYRASSSLVFSMKTWQGVTAFWLLYPEICF